MRLYRSLEAEFLTEWNCIAQYGALVADGHVIAMVCISGSSENQRLGLSLAKGDELKGMFVLYGQEHIDDFLRAFGVNQSADARADHADVLFDRPVKVVFEEKPGGARRIIGIARSGLEG
ncbi:MAG: hypothetical protein V1659_02590 [Candidatus Woesearchaeota archaeon]